MELMIENSSDAPIEDPDSDDKLIEVEGIDANEDQTGSNTSLDVDNDVTSLDTASFHADANDTEIFVKQEFKAEIDDEMIDLPLVEFDPNKGNGSLTAESGSIAAESSSKQIQSNSSNAQKKLKRNGAGQFECTVCGFSSRYKKYLNRHQQIHGKNAAKPFKCRQCSYASRFKWGLNRHQQFMHKNIIFTM